MNNDGFTALTKCFFCNGDNAVLLNTRPGLPNRFIQEAHGKVADMTSPVES